MHDQLCSCHTAEINGRNVWHKGMINLILTKRVVYLWLSFLHTCKRSKNRFGLLICLPWRWYSEASTSSRAKMLNSVCVSVYIYIYCSSAGWLAGSTRKKKINLIFLYVKHTYECQTHCVLNWDGIKNNLIYLIIYININNF